ncbi:MAG: YraN family protein [Candidatus Latescibacteria bacterium]|nr:YraN family protein [Candidatus Latescibacterota bacterium]
MPDTTRARGARGEAIAARFLAAKGYEILDRNYRAGRGELDLIVRQDDCLVFVEVKTGSSRQFGPPETWVDVRKQRRVTRAAVRYLQTHGLNDAACRFDVVGICQDRGRTNIVHIENAFWSEE